LPPLYCHFAGDLDARRMPNPDETYIVRVRRDEARSQTVKGATMKRLLLVMTLALAVGLPASTASAASGKASCVGQFSTFFAHGGDGTHRSAVAQNFAHNRRPAGRNVYSQVARLHGNLQECVNQTS
jgi:hypothetical protein